MLESGINATLITQREHVVLERITSLFIFNYSNVDMKVTHNFQTEIIPPYDDVNRFARSYDIPGDFTFSKVDLTVEFVGGTGKAVMRYRQVKQSNECK